MRRAFLPVYIQTEFIITIASSFCDGDTYG